MRRRCLLAYLVMWSVCPSPADDYYTRWAIIASPQLGRSGLVDLLSVALAAKPNLQLVERERISAITTELKLANMFGAEASGERLKLGRLLRADGLLLLRHEKQDQRAFVRAIISECRYGARLRVVYVPYIDKEPEKLVTSLSALVTQTRAQYSQGVKRIIGVPPFVSRSLIHDLDYLQGRLACVLQSALTALPGTAVLKLEEARVIDRELELAGTERRPGVVPWFVEAEYRLEGTEPRGDRGIKLNLRLTDGRGVLRNIEKKFPDVPQLVDYLGRRAIVELLEPGDADAPPGLTIDEQIARLTAQAESFTHLGSYALAVEMLEACLLIDPDHKQPALYLLTVYGQIIAGDPRPRTSWELDTHTSQTWRNRIAVWRRAGEVIERLIRRSLITQWEAVEANATIASAFHGLLSDLPDCRSPYRRHLDAAALTEVDQALACLSAERREFLDQVYSRSVSLSSSGNATKRRLC